MYRSLQKGCSKGSNIFTCCTKIFWSHAVVSIKVQESVSAADSLTDEGHDQHGVAANCLLKKVVAGQIDHHVSMLDQNASDIPRGRQWRPWKDPKECVTDRSQCKNTSSKKRHWFANGRWPAKVTTSIIFCRKIGFIMSWNFLMENEAPFVISRKTTCIYGKSICKCPDFIFQAWSLAAKICFSNCCKFFIDELVTWELPY